MSRVTRRLEEQVEALRSAAIEDTLPYMYLDASSSTLAGLATSRTSPHLWPVAYGVGLDGYRQLLGSAIGAQKSEESWSELLANLVARGLRGVRLVMADEHAGVSVAVRTLLPAATPPVGCIDPMITGSRSRAITITSLEMRSG